MSESGESVLVRTWRSGQCVLKQTWTEECCGQAPDQQCSQMMHMHRHKACAMDFSMSSAASDPFLSSPAHGAVPGLQVTPMEAPWAPPHPATQAARQRCCRWRSSGGCTATRQWGAWRRRRTAAAPSSRAAATGTCSATPLCPPLCPPPWLPQLPRLLQLQPVLLLPMLTPAPKRLLIVRSLSAGHVAAMRPITQIDPRSLRQQDRRHLLPTRLQLPAKHAM